MSDYDPAVLRKFSDIMYKRAFTSILCWSFLGAVAGWIGSLFLRVQLSGVTAGGFILTAVGGLIGFLIGRERAYWYKLEAQRTLCQLQIEQNTRKGIDP